MAILILIALFASSTVSKSTLPSFSSSLDTSYVVQLHGNRDDFSLPGDGSKMRTQLMATESGQHFECFLPPLHSNTESKEAISLSVPQSPNANEAEKEKSDAFLSFGRAAAEKMKPKCIVYVDKETNAFYEVCVGLSVQFTDMISFFSPKESLSTVDVEVDAASATSTNKGKDEVLFNKDFSGFIADSIQPLLRYDYFVLPEVQARVKSHEKPLYTQTFGSDVQIQVQFICNISSQGDGVIAVQWTSTPREGEARKVAAFLVGSGMFCDPKYSDADPSDVTSVRSLLQPLEIERTCVTRIEGWWTYEFCFGRSLRQFHRDGDGRIEIEFSLGTFDVAGNLDLERLGSALVSEPIDATHEVSRPAYLELYDGGTNCKGFESRAPRKAKVFYYCSQGGLSHHILSVKETQTCSYTVKISTPVLCGHPHFLNDIQKSDQGVEILHCFPVAEDAIVIAE